MIEPAGAGDIDAMARLHAACFDTSWSADAISRMLDNPAALAVAARRPTFAGFAMAWVAAGDAEVLTVAVSPERRRTGVGASLLTAVAAAALARGARTLHLDVAETNAAARALYAKLGYREIGRRRGYYVTESGPVDALVLRLDLEPAPV